MLRTSLPIVTPALVVAALATACGRSATQPQTPRDADLATRESIYAAHELTYVDSWFTRKWRRADGEYDLRRIESAVAAYPASREAHETAKTRALAVSLVGGLGGGIVGFTAGYQLGVAEDERMSDKAMYTMLGAGAVLVLIGVTLDRTWVRDAAKELAATYNADLRNDLALPPLR